MFRSMGTHYIYVIHVEYLRPSDRTYLKTIIVEKVLQTVEADDMTTQFVVTLFLEVRT